MARKGEMVVEQDKGVLLKAENISKKVAIGGIITTVGGEFLQKQLLVFFGLNIAIGAGAAYLMFNVLRSRDRKLK